MAQTVLLLLAITMVLRLLTILRRKSSRTFLTHTINHTRVYNNPLTFTNLVRLKATLTLVNIKGSNTRLTIMMLKILLLVSRTP